MKLKSLIMFSAAALAFAACSNEEEGINPSGDELSAVVISVISPDMANGSRAVTDGTPATPNTVKIEGSLTVEVQVNGAWETCTPDNGKYVKYDLTAVPTAVRAYINDGEKVSDETSIANVSAPNMQAGPKSIPAYGKADVSGNFREETVDGKVYRVYSGSINMEIPVARLEVGNITHVDASGSCRYTNLKLQAVYMDHIYPTKGAVSTTDYFLPQGGSLSAPILVDEFEGGVDFGTSVTLPANDQVYAFNFYGGTSAANNPSFKMYFTQNANGQQANRYAFITKYKNAEGSEIPLQNGHIYRITGVELSDENIGPNEEPDENYLAVEVTVTEAVWTVETIEAEWEK